LGKRRMVDIVEEVCRAPTTSPPQSEPLALPTPDCSGDEALAAMLAAQYADEHRAEMAVQFDDLFDDPDDLENQMQGLDVEQQRARCAKYKSETDYLIDLMNQLDGKRGSSPPVVELTPDFLDDNELNLQSLNVVVGVPVTSSYFMGTNPFEHIPSPVKQAKKKPRGLIKIDPEEEEEDAAVETCSAPSSQEPVFVPPAIEAVD
jgi:hypothetical protein